MFFRKQCWYLVSELCMGLLNALKFIGVKPAYYFEACGVQRLHLQEVCACKAQALYPEEIYGIIPYQKFFMSCCINFKKTSTCGSQVGHM